MKLVIVESPYGSEFEAVVEANIKYARACMADCLRRGEAPFASHLLYTQPGVLKDLIPEERTLGTAAGLAWGMKADITAVYVDRGMSAGMKQGIEAAEAAGRPVQFRMLPGWHS